jgi:ribosomal protein L20
LKQSSKQNLKGTRKKRNLKRKTIPKAKGYRGLVEKAIKVSNFALSSNA